MADINNLSKWRPRWRQTWGGANGGKFVSWRELRGHLILPEFV